MQANGRAELRGAAELCRSPDAVMAKVAARQQGFVAVGQLRALGVSRHQIHGRVQRRVLFATAYRGVFSVGPPRPGRAARWWAAFLACGPRSALGERSAGVGWDIVRSEGARVTLLVPPGTADRPGLIVRRVRTLRPQDRVTTESGLVMTSLARTLVDLERVLDDQGLVSAFVAAEDRHQLDVRAVHEVLARTRRPRTRERVLAAMAEVAQVGLTLTDSVLEDVLQALCREHGLPLPEPQVRLAGADADAYWVAVGLVLEADGYAFHRDRHRFQADRALDRRRSALGLTTLRFTHADLVHRGAASAGEIRAALARLGWAGG